MNAFIVYAHPEPKSFNGALLARGVETLRASGHEVEVSDLYRMGFDPVSDRRNFSGVKDPDCFKQQQEEIHASQTGWFAPGLAAEMEKLRLCGATARCGRLCRSPCRCPRPRRSARCADAGRCATA